MTSFHLNLLWPVLIPPESWRPDHLQAVQSLEESALAAHGQGDIMLTMMIAAGFACCLWPTEQTSESSSPCVQGDKGFRGVLCCRSAAMSREAGISCC